MKNVKMRLMLLLLLFYFASIANISVIANSVGVKSGDYIKWERTYADASPSSPYVQWEMLQILAVSKEMVTIRLTQHLSDGTETSHMYDVDVRNGTYTYIIPANSKGGDLIGEYLPITGETTRTYAGVSRTVVYTIVWPVMVGATPKRNFLG